MYKNLLSAKPGDTGKIRLIDAGKCATRRLCEIGLNIGTPVKIVKNDIGPVIVSIAGNKIALGRGLAAKVNIETFQQVE